MEQFSKDIYEAKTKVISAMANSSRLWIIETLSKGEVCVCELVKGLNLDFSTVSKHLTVLKNAGIVADNKRGKQVFYSLKVPCILKFMSCIEDVIKKDIQEKSRLIIKGEK